MSDFGGHNLWSETSSIILNDDLGKKLISKNEHHSILVNLLNAKY